VWRKNKKYVIPRDEMKTLVENHRTKKDLIKLCFVCSTEGDGKRETVEGRREDFGKCCGEDW